jgi:hypothetical protein
LSLSHGDLSNQRDECGRNDEAPMSNDERIAKHHSAHVFPPESNHKSILIDTNFSARE